MQLFHEHLRSIRKNRGLTQRQVAQRAGVTERNYQLYESGTQRPGFETIVSLADVFGVSVDFLLGRTDDPTPPATHEGHTLTYTTTTGKPLTAEQHEKVLEYIAWISRDS